MLGKKTAVYGTGRFRPWSCRASGCRLLSCRASGCRLFDRLGKDRSGMAAILRVGAAPETWVVPLWPLGKYLREGGLVNRKKWKVPAGHVWAIDESPEDNDTVQGVTAEGGALEASSDKEVIERSAFYFASGGWNGGASSCFATEGWHVLVQRGWDPQSARFAIEQLALSTEGLREQAGFGKLSSATGRFKPVVDAVRFLES